MSDYPMLISNKLHSFRNFVLQIYDIFFINQPIYIDFMYFLMCRCTKPPESYPAGGFFYSFCAI